MIQAKALLSVRYIFLLIGYCYFPTKKYSLIALSIFLERVDDTRCDFSSAGRNSYFILEPGYQVILESEEEDGEKIQLIMSVLDETKIVDGVETRVVEERESKGGNLVEVSRNYFAICKPTNDVFYFGEDVDICEDGEIVSHEGAALSNDLPHILHSNCLVGLLVEDEKQALFCLTR